MSRRDAAVRMRHMLDHAREAAAMLAGKTQADIAESRQLHLALTRLVEVVGEAAAQVPAEERKRFPGIDWDEAIRMRNRLIHGYDTVRTDILWDTITDDFPPLIVALERALGSG